MKTLYNMHKVLPENKVITGYWGHEPIWREKTAEERLKEANIDVVTANLFIKITNAQY